MKSLSLDSPESSELQTSRTRRCLPSTSGYIGYGGSGGNSEHVTPPSNNSRLHCKSIYCWLIALIIVFTPIKYANIFTLYFPLIFLNLVHWYLSVCVCAAPSSPSNQRKLLHATRAHKTGSVDLPDDVEKSHSSASTSPCPSPVRFQVRMKSASLWAHRLHQ